MGSVSRGCLAVDRSGTQGDSGLVLGNSSLGRDADASGRKAFNGKVSGRGVCAIALSVSEDLD